MKSIGRRHEKFFLWVDMWDPHEPFDPPWYDLWRYADPHFEGDRIFYPPYGRNSYMSDDEAKFVRALYAGQVTTVDRWVGRILETVERLGLDRNTMIVHITDHGHLFGEHDLEGKPGGQLGNLYQVTTHVPMFIRHPDGVGAGRRIGGIVQPQDVMPTVLEAAGIKVPDGLYGRSLLPLMNGDVQKVRDHAVSGRFPAVVEGRERQPGVGHLFDGWVGSDRVVEALTVTDDDGWAMVCNPKGRPSELYDLSTDPAQQANVADQHPDRAKAMYAKAVESLEQGGGLPDRLRPFTEGVPQAATRQDTELFAFRDDRGNEVAFPTEREALAMGRDASGELVRKVERTRFGDLLSRNPHNLVFVHGQYYWASDLA
jgi:arylsulfatase A-like enzyme